MTPRVSIIVVSYNTRELTLACLRSVFEQTFDTPFELLVVDNASTDGSAAAISAEFPQVALIANQANRGFAAANNQGLSRSCGRYLLLLNPDTLIEDRAIDRMVGFMEKNPDIGCSGCQVFEDAITIQRTCFRFPSAVHLWLDATGLSKSFPRSSWFGRYWYGDWDRRSARDVDVVSGMFMLLRREVYDAIGPLDEAYFVYGEEADWCFQMHRRGIRRVFTPIARIIHRDGGGKSTKLASRRMYVQMQKSLLIFLRKNRGVLSWAGAKLILCIANLGRWAVFRLFGLASGAERARAKASQSSAALRFHCLGASPE
ncbi:MAG: glycosyltransferase family 2 protein [Phycisphaerales bacterium]|nr:glycosyltransferase family 2 protein [Phycisphaerales bacterium]